MSIISKKINVIQNSVTLNISARISELKQQNIDVISLSAGEPEFNTAINIQNAAIKAMKSGMTRYTEISGIKELKTAICNKLKYENEIEYNEKEVIICNGAKHALYNLLASTVNECDEVIIIKPYWVSYTAMAKIVGAKIVFLETSIEKGFRINLQELDNKINENTKWLILNSPNNPTGVIYSYEELLSIADIIYKHPKLNIICDNTYEKIIFNNMKFYNLAMVAPKLRDRIFIINSVSKSYAMTGWRIGYCIGNAEIIAAMNKLQSHTTSNACSISQFAALEAIEGKQDYIKNYVNNWEKKTTLLLKYLKQLGFQCYKPEGTFYLFPNISTLFGKETPKGKMIQSSQDLAIYLLNEALVSVVPGSAFGADEYIRISSTVDETLIEKSYLKIEQAIEKLK
ncbi:pyridoxal phosphate-dependent aminotransferase [Rickettsia endosymbiont of Cardiosporidium cionae]|uniref:pyridoxal phosphate-dependent aminotransferase n=1 Tax=Rickettsia endosymbiont of Cardiosporidium cionae TaxID=2777155 RepID=UPI00189393E7|nr:pyridoxal phosphate-dependent aminotransferase [Rickettsia endosymbiont of Cardiosporidium cionae]KAF8818124.1 pyridoxal phosphate-dependent aminotransferase [Rickettsia endosymbiont of Cardiosporidium cionae]